MRYAKMMTTSRKVAIAVVERVLVAEKDADDDEDAESVEAGVDDEDDDDDDDLDDAERAECNAVVKVSISKACICR